MKKSLLTIADVQALHRAGRLEEAKQGYLEIIKQHPQAVSALHLLGLLYAEENDLDEAQHYLEQANQLEPNDPTYSLHLANILKTKGLFSQAGQILQDLVKTHPRLAAAFNNLGTVYFAQKKWPEAIRAYQTAIDIQPDYVDAYYNLGLVYGKLKRFDEAINAYEAIIALVPQHPGARFQSGCLLMQQHNYQAAVAQFAAIEQMYPFHFETQTNLATCSLKLGKLNEAKAHYLKALEIVPNDVQILFNLGVISMQQGYTNEAINYYLQAVKIDPGLYDAQHNLGFIFLVKRDTENALLHFRAALDLQPDNTALRHTINIITGGKDLASSPPEYIRSLFDSYADHFDSHLLQVLHYRVPQLMYETVREHRELAPASLDILDLGCGTGLCGEPFQAAARSLIGVDISEKMLVVAAAKNIYADLIQSDIQPYLDSTEQAFDLIIAGDVLVYFGELASFFTSIKRILKPGGMFIFNVEIGAKDDYKMTPSGRFAHSKTYIDGLIQKNHLNTVFYRQAALRTQNEADVMGQVYLIRNADDEARAV